MADATEAVLGMVPMVAALGVLNKTTQMIGGSTRPARKKVGLVERKISLRRR
jgi:hypothetical protein